MADDGFLAPPLGQANPLEYCAHSERALRIIEQYGVFLNPMHLAGL
jgi:hypothetical protein